MRSLFATDEEGQFSDYAQSLEFDILVQMISPYNKVYNAPNGMLNLMT